MATYTLNIPNSSGNRFFDLVSPTNWNSREVLRDTVIKGIVKDYGSIIKNVAKMTNVTPDLITAFIAVESGGKKHEKDGYNSGKNPKASDGKIMGLMQWNRDYVYEMLEKEKNDGRLTPAEEKILNDNGLKFTKVGTKFQLSGSSVVQSGKYRAIKAEVAVRPEVNILIGAIKIGQMMDAKWGTTNGNLRIDRMAYAYNKGNFSADTKKSQTIDTDTIDPTKASMKYPANIKQFKEYKVAQIDSAGAGSYVRKLLGKNGVLDIIHNDLPDLFK